jgi:hypothetical protein
MKKCLLDKFRIEPIWIKVDVTVNLDKFKLNESLSN